MTPLKSTWFANALYSTTIKDPIVYPIFYIVTLKPESCDLHGHLASLPLSISVFCGDIMVYDVGFQKKTISSKK